MVGEFRSEQAAESARKIKRVVDLHRGAVESVYRALESLEYDWHKSTGPAKLYPGVRVYLHDQLATCEELLRMLEEVDIYEHEEE